MNQYARAVVLTALLLGTLVILWRLERLDRNLAAGHAELQSALDERAKAIKGLVVQQQRTMALLELQWARYQCDREGELTVSEIERDPCMVVCRALIPDQILYTESLNERICEMLP